MQLVKHKNSYSMYKLIVWKLPEGCDWHSNSLSIGFLQFSHLSGLLDTEMDLIAVLAHNLQLDVLGIFTHFVFGSLNAMEKSLQDGDLLGSVGEAGSSPTLVQSRPANLEIIWFLYLLKGFQ